MSKISSFEREIKKLEDNIEKQQKKIEDLKEKYREKKISGDSFSLKKEKIVDKIRAMNSRMRLLQGGIVREKRFLQDKKMEE